MPTIQSSKSLKKNQRKGMFHGKEKTGKSTLASSFPNPVFFDFENGTKFLGNEVAVVPMWEESFDEILKFTTSEELEPFETIVFDTVDWLDRIIEKDVKVKNKVKAINDIPFGKGKALMRNRWNDILECLTWQHETKNKWIVLLCHSQVKKIDDPQFPQYDSWQLKLSDKTGELLSEWVDLIGYLSLDTVLSTEDRGFGKTATKASGGKERILHVGSNPAYLAGNRFGLPDQLPATYVALQDAITQAESGSESQQPTT